MNRPVARMRTRRLTAAVRRGIRGAGGGGGEDKQHKPVESPDSLHSIAYAKIVDLVSEGEIEGFPSVLASGVQADILKDIYLDQTPIANGDGSLNFKNVVVDSRVGTQTQDYMKGFPSVENEIALNTVLLSSASFTRAISDLSLDAIRMRLSVNALSKSDATTGDIMGYVINYAIDISTDGGAYVEVINANFDGKTGNVYERSHRIDLPKATVTGWNVRVRRITANQNSVYIQDTTNVVSITEIVDVKMRYPNSALVGIQIDASQFQNIPTRSFDLKGRRIQVPANYNPITRVYATSGAGTSGGAWDGTFKVAWSDNPAWVFYDLVTHTRYGLGNLVSASLIDKWSLYGISQYCDGYVPTGVPKRAPVTTGSITMTASIPNIYARSTGSFTTDGFAVGDEINATGFATNGNNGRSVITAVTALQIFVDSDHAITGESALGGRTLVTQNPTEPRMTCNLFLQQQADAYKVLGDLASIFRGICYWSNGSIVPVSDRPTDPVYTYTNANVEGGLFRYEGSGRRARHTVALVSWSDPSDFGRAKVEYVEDDVAINRYGVNQMEIIGIGTTSRWAARRIGRWALLSERLETQTCTWTVGIDGTYAVPGQVVRVADTAQAGRRVGGRVKASSTSTYVLVDAWPAVMPVAGDTIVTTNPAGISQDRVISVVDAANFKITPTVAFGAGNVPLEGSIWAVETSVLKLQNYRVLSVAENSEGKGYTIVGLEHNESKFAAVDYGAPVEIPTTSALPSAVQYAPATVTVSSVERAGSVIAAIGLSATWPAIAGAVKYLTQWKKDNGNWTPKVETPTTHGEYPGAVFPGKYFCRVYAVNSGRAVSVGKTSALYTVNDQTMQPTSVSSAAASAVAAQAAANAANSDIANMVSDNVLSAVEKKRVINDYNILINDQPGIDAQATSFSITTEKTAYDTAITALTTYLGTLTTPVAWNSLSGVTTVVGATFRGKFADVYNKETLLLNKIYALAKSRADTAQAAADAAQTSANTANAEITNITADSVLSKSEKSRIVQDWNDVLNEHAGIDTQASTYGVTTEKTTYDNAYSSLSAYLTGLSPAWNDPTTNTTIVAATFRSKWNDLYNARQVLLQKIADLVTFGNTAGSGVNILWDEYSRFTSTSVPPIIGYGTTRVMVPDATTQGGYALKVTNNDVVMSDYVYFGSSSVDYNLPLQPGKYIVSYWAQASFAGRLIRPIIKTNGTANLLGASATLTAGWVRYSCVINITDATCFKGSLYFQTNLSGVAGSFVLFDRIMIEKQVGGDPTPSPFVIGHPSRLATAAQEAANAAQAAANAAQLDATNAQTNANSANAALADIASDSLLTPGEKPVVIKDRDDIINQQADIDAKAALYGMGASKTNYDNAVSALTTYLATLTNSVLWSSLAGNTTIVGATFRTKFLDVYNTRQLLLNGIASTAKVLADNAQNAANAAQAAADAAQSTANSANTAANAANTDLANIASDSLLTPGEKPNVIRDRDQLINEQASIDAQAVSYSITTEKTTYDTAVSALTTYLATLTSPVLWSSLVGNTTIVGATFRAKFLDVFNARQVLLQKIADVVTYGNTAGSGVNILWDEYSRFLTGIPVVSSSTCTLVWDGTLRAVGNSSEGSLKVTTGSATQDDSFNLTDVPYAVPATPGKYIVSMFVRSPTAGHKVSALFLYSTGVATGKFSDATITTANVWQRISWVVDASASNMTSFHMRVYPNQSAVTGRIVNFDGIMIEPQVGSDSTPSAFVPGHAGRIADQAQTNAAIASNNAAAAQTAANSAQTDATSAINTLTNIASDSLLTAGEKPVIIRDRDAITNEQANIDAKATLYGMGASKTNYDNACSALTTYLATLTTPVLWSTLTGDTTIVGATFSTKFLDVYNTRQLLLNGMAAVAKTLADNAQTAANNAQTAATNAQVAANSAQTDATSAINTLTNIANDNLLTQGEKPTIIRDRDEITNEQANIDAKATLYGMGSSKINYDNAVSALTTYLATLTTPVLWSTLTGDTTIVGATFRTKFLDVYNTRQLLLNGIVAVAKTLADNAQGTGNAAQTAATNAQVAANSAQADANTANTAITNIASDALLSAGEKPTIIRDRDAITNEQAGIDAQATSYGITTEKTTYDNAVAALVSYLATLTTPVLWSTLTGDTTIVGATFRTKFLDVYNTRQLLLNKIAAAAKVLADNAQGMANSKNVTFNQTTTPVALTTGDLWYNPTTGVLNRWNGSLWVATSDATLSQISGAGVNILPDEYSIFQSATLPAFVTSGAMTLTRNTSFHFQLGAIQIVANSTDQYVYLGTGYNVIVRPQRKYILSFWIQSSIGSVVTNCFIFDGTNTYTGTVTTPGANLTGRVSYAFDLSASVSSALRIRLDNDGGAGCTMQWDGIMLEEQIGLGATPSAYVRGTPASRVIGPIEMSDNDGWNDGGRRRIGLRFGASGHRLGDLRNQVITGVGSVGSRWSGAAITFSIPSTGDPASVTFNVAAGTLQVGSVPIAYSASSGVLTQTRSTTVTYYLYYIDATYAGGARTLNVTTNGQNLANADDRVWIGNATVAAPALGVTGGGGGDPGGGCVDGAMWIDSTRQAEKIVKGDWIDTVDDHPRRELRAVSLRVTGNVIKIQPCYRITTEGGAQVVAGETTPMTLRNGQVRTIGQMLDQEVLTDQDGVLRWERVVEVTEVGNRPVSHISVHDTSYFAGANPRYRIATHNTTYKP